MPSLIEHDLIQRWTTTGFLSARMAFAQAWPGLAWTSARKPGAVVRGRAWLAMMKAACDHACLLETGNVVPVCNP
jgi:hypothetical protein